jgi:hypothetical protein
LAKLGNFTLKPKAAEMPASAFLWQCLCATLSRRLANPRERLTPRRIKFQILAALMISEMMAHGASRSSCSTTEEPMFLDSHKPDFHGRHKRHQIKGLLSQSIKQVLQALTKDKQNSHRFIHP